MFVALIVQTFRTAHSGVGLAAPPAHWVTGADVAQVERIQYATRWRQEIRRDRDDLRAIDVALHERLQNGSAARDILRGVRDDLLDVTHELAEHLESGEEVFKVEKRRKVLKRSLKGAQKVLEAMDRAGGKDYEEISVQTEALRKKLSQLKKHIKFVPDDPEPARPVTRWPMYIFLTGAVVCLFFSTMCHTYCCVGEIDAERMWRLRLSWHRRINRGELLPHVALLILLPSRLERYVLDWHYGIRVFDRRPYVHASVSEEGVRPVTSVPLRRPRLPGSFPDFSASLLRLAHRPDAYDGSILF